MAGQTTTDQKINPAIKKARSLDGSKEMLDATGILDYFFLLADMGGRAERPILSRTMGRCKK